MTAPGHGGADPAAVGAGVSGGAGAGSGPPVEATSPGLSGTPSSPSPWVHVPLEGTHVRLEPLTREHLPGLVEVGADPDLWRWTTTRADTPEGMARYVEAALAEAESGRSFPFATVERSSGRVVGSTRFGTMDRGNRRVEIGWTWLAAPWQRTALNTEAKLLMLRHAFEVLGCIRVELKTDVLNQRSRTAILRLGAVEEGTLRHHVIVEGGRIRDTVYFSILAAEWPGVEAALEARLRRAPGGVGPVTELLLEAGGGNREALDRLLPLVYEGLLELARVRLASESPGHTWATADLVHEAWLRLVDQSRVEWQNRAHFNGVAALAMRRVLVDHARARTAVRRGGGVAAASLDQVIEEATGMPVDRFLDLDRALDRLARENPRGADVVLHRFFGGLNHEEIARTLGLSVITVRRAWDAARAWLRAELDPA